MRQFLNKPISQRAFRVVVVGRNRKAGRLGGQKMARGNEDPGMTGVRPDEARLWAPMLQQQVANCAGQSSLLSASVACSPAANRLDLEDSIPRDAWQSAEF